jgi:hypothetical protein
VLRPMNTWLESIRFACEVQGVISMRLVRLAQGGPKAAAEANWMIAEKVDSRGTRLRPGASACARQ